MWLETNLHILNEYTFSLMLYLCLFTWLLFIPMIYLILNPWTGAQSPIITLFLWGHMIHFVTTWFMIQLWEHVVSEVSVCLYQTYYANKFLSLRQKTYSKKEGNYCSMCILSWDPQLFMRLHTEELALISAYCIYSLAMGPNFLSCCCHLTVSLHLSYSEAGKERHSYDRAGKALSFAFSSFFK